MKRSTAHVSFIGAVGLPNTYGGFEGFLEHCAPRMAELVGSVTVTCDRAAYPDSEGPYQGVSRIFLSVRANGAWSVLHDLLAFAAIWRRSTHIVVLGVSGGLWFPLFRCLSGLSGKTLAVNVDGVEWKRAKFSGARKAFLFILDWLAQRFAHVIVYDNEALRNSIAPSTIGKSVMIPYSGDHVLRLGHDDKRNALTVCRIEPENNLEMMIEGALQSSIDKYIIIGNWNASEFGRRLRARYAAEARLELLDAIYDKNILATYRETCGVYLHGHSVGGTNPSLVEMLFYDCPILCLDVAYHRATAGDCASYFASASELQAMLADVSRLPLGDRAEARRRYRRDTIVEDYLQALGLEP